MFASGAKQTAISVLSTMCCMRRRHPVHVPEEKGIFSSRKKSQGRGRLHVHQDLAISMLPPAQICLRGEPGEPVNTDCLYFILLQAYVWLYWLACKSCSSGSSAGKGPSDDFLRPQKQIA